MSEILKIECPKCGKKFDAGSAFNAHIESTKKQQEEIIKKESEKKFKSQLESKDKEIDKTRKEAEKRIKNSVSTEFQNKIQKKDDEIEKIKKLKEITESRLAKKLKK